MRAVACARCATTFTPDNRMDGSVRDAVMITPSRIAVAGSCAMVVSMVAANGIVQIAGRGSSSASLSEWLASTAAGALGIGLLVWIGMYFGARFAPPHQRNGRLVRLAAIAFAVLGVLLALPIKTHAVRLDMPSAGDASASQFLPVLIPVALIAAVVLGAGLITRALAAGSGSRVA
jgi:hypothetical protein